MMTNAFTTTFLKTITLVTSLILFIGCGNDSARSEKDTFRGSSQKAQLGGSADAEKSKTDVGSNAQNDHKSSDVNVDIKTSQQNSSTGVGTGKESDTPDMTTANECDVCQKKCDDAFKYKCARNYNQCHTMCKNQYQNMCKDVPLVPLGLY